MITPRVRTAAIAAHAVLFPKFEAAGFPFARSSPAHQEMAVRVATAILKADARA